MAARLRFFGPLREAAGAAEMPAPEGAATVSALIDCIAVKDAALASRLRAPSVRVAVDRAIVAPDAPIAGAREIAFLPAYSGG
jgi:molybdopterin synthase sulfur carrier subunit